VRDGARGA
jgi:hypothetical protein